VDFKCNHDGSCDKVKLCCIETEMLLSREDIERIKKLGYSETDFVEEYLGFFQLKNIDGHCVFYDPETTLCKIYNERPQGCRFYPIIYDLDNEQCIVDNYCPSASTVSKEDIETVCPRLRQFVKRLMLQKI